VALEVGIVGPSGSGKTSLFTALTKTGGGEYGKTNVGMAPIADERLGQLAEVVKARKITPATIRVQDIPGSSQLGNLRQVDALLVVVRSPDDLEEFKLELLVADRDHVERRLERVEKQAKSGDANLRAELEDLKKILAHVDAGGVLADYPGELPGELEPLTTKPLIAIENGPNGIDLLLEAELAELPDDEAAEFRGGGSSALEDIAGRLAQALDLITFFTAGEQDTRAWTLRNGQTALDAAGAIHTDIARGFIRCEVVNWQDLVALGSHAEVAKQGKQGLEGKTYVVRDGDVLNIRFDASDADQDDASEGERDPGALQAGNSLVQQARGEDHRHHRVERRQHRRQRDQAVARGGGEEHVPDRVADADREGDHEVPP
jgi:ribosome-binding ATPase YchF (GTP1/OBG family)